MPGEELFKSEQTHSRAEIARTLSATAEWIESGTVRLEKRTEERDVPVPEAPLFDVELEPLTDSETGDERNELEDGMRWTGWPGSTSGRRGDHVPRERSSLERRQARIDPRLDLGRGLSPAGQRRRLEPEELE